jgi:SAM-dependent methyltransferase
MQERHLNKEKYFNEQAFTTSKYVVPYINSFRKIEPGVEILEIGCGEGGNMQPFLEIGCKVTGVDISSNKIENAEKFLSARSFKYPPILLAEDIYNCNGKLKGPYDLIIMRDVIEHIHDQDRFMGFVKRFLKKDGLFFLAFPPWYNPFGGHQQICVNPLLSRLPYYHILPKSVYRFLLKTGGEDNQKIHNLLEIKDTGISIERFEKILLKHQYHTLKKTFFFVNPNYDIKFGLKPRRQIRPLTALVFLRNFVITSCYYLVKNL